MNSLKPQLTETEEMSCDVFANHSNSVTKYPVDDCYLENGEPVFKGKSHSTNLYPMIAHEVEPLSYKQI